MSFIAIGALDYFDARLATRTNPIETIFPDANATLDGSLNDKPNIGHHAFTDDDCCVLIRKSL